MCKCIKIIEDCFNSCITFPVALVISVYIICSTIIIYKLISVINDLMYIIHREHPVDKLWSKIFVIILIILIIIVMVFLLVKCVLKMF